MGPTPLGCDPSVRLTQMKTKSPCAKTSQAKSASRSGSAWQLISQAEVFPPECWADTKQCNVTFFSPTILPRSIHDASAGFQRSGHLSFKGKPSHPRSVQSVRLTAGIHEMSKSRPSQTSTSSPRNLGNSNLLVHLPNACLAPTRWPDHPWPHHTSSHKIDTSIPSSNIRP